jgi:predicted AlkP superfamily pyrophosphatase or phosphodiesterase
MLHEHRAVAPALAALTGGPVPTVVPSTTAAALTSITTGTAPAEHGVVGYRMRTGGQVLDVLRWQVPRGHAPDPAEIAPLEPFLGKEIPVVTRGEFIRTGFTAAHMRGARFVGWRTTSTLIAQCRRLVGAGERLVYAYYDGIDRVAHEFGIRDEYLVGEIVATDRLVADLVGALPGDCTLLVTADHGQVHIGRDGWLALDGLAPVIDGYAGDGRFRYLYAKGGAARELHEAALDRLGDVAWVFTREQLVDEGWFGPDPPSTAVARRIGDVVLAARGSAAFTDPTHLKETGLVAGHGSLTRAEMLVPLLAARGHGNGS